MSRFHLVVFNQQYFRHQITIASSLDD